MGNIKAMLIETVDTMSSDDMLYASIRGCYPERNVENNIKRLDQHFFDFYDKELRFSNILFMESISPEDLSINRPGFIK